VTILRSGSFGKSLEAKKNRNWKNTHEERSGSSDNYGFDEIVLEHKSDTRKRRQQRSLEIKSIDNDGEPKNSDSTIRYGRRWRSAERKETYRVVPPPTGTHASDTISRRPSAEHDNKNRIRAISFGLWRHSWCTLFNLRQASKDDPRWKMQCGTARLEPIISNCHIWVHLLL
jgi:hypothetical protein